ncbi:GGDEF domain-containing protein [Amycolatopsis antarctica]|uniref:GGDEF domain-containing protein n=2 Tax=Amycolatopsis antarctica TaxID=1854586 RepID=A0A263D7M8_9PSEU|nr:GGDEF domain-containing protein [Amycolatopsis antarctica]
MIVFLAVWEIAAVVLLSFGIATAGEVTATDWTRLAALAGCATLHIQLTRRQEERRRNRIASVHIDLSGIWTFPAALLLPIHLTLLLIAIVRGQRWVNSRRPPHKFVFTTFTVAVAALVAQRLFEALAADDISRLDQSNGLRMFALLMLVGFAYALVQALIIGSLLALGGTASPTLRNVLGSKSDNLLEASTIGLGTIATVLLVNLPPSIIILVLVSVVGNRLAEINQLQSEARTDAKTGVLNVRGWTESAQRALNRASRSSEELALLMIDLDHFKWINDTFGHPAGDDVLRSVAQTLGEVTRPADVVGRFGGEEFLILLPDIDRAGAELAAERVRSAIEDLRIVTTDKRGGQTTVAGRTTSIGVAVYPRHADSLEAMLQAADGAVYDAKESGRNLVRFAADVPPDASVPPAQRTEG